MAKGTTSARSAAPQTPPTSPGGNSTGAIEAELKIIDSKISQKPGALGVFGLILAGLAIPFAIVVAWFPREIDALSASIVELKASVDDASLNASAAATASSEVAARIDGLVVSIARGDARAGSESLVALSEFLPRETFVSLQLGGKLESFRYSDFNGAKWVFVKRPDFNELTAEEQDAVSVSLARYDVRFFVDE